MDINQIKKIIKESYLKEIGDLKNTQSYNFTQVDSDTWEFDTDFGKVKVEFEDLGIPTNWKDKGLEFKVKHNNYDYSQEMYNVFYAIDNVTSQIQKTNYKELLKIINTVVKIIDVFIKQKSPYSLIIAGVDKKGTSTTDKQKNTLYLTIASKHLPPGYRISEIKIISGGFGNDGYILFKDK